MRETVTLLIAGAALVYAILAYQKADEISEIVSRLDSQVAKEAQERNRVLTLGQKLENLAGRFVGSGRKAPSQSP
jgi:outer membrane murein-binding lipoprotein Lpp